MNGRHGANAFLVSDWMKNHNSFWLLYLRLQRSQRSLDWLTVEISNIAFRYNQLDLYWFNTAGTKKSTRIRRQRTIAIWLESRNSHLQWFLAGLLSMVASCTFHRSGANIGGTRRNQIWSLSLSVLAPESVGNNHLDMYDKSRLPVALVAWHLESVPCPLWLCLPVRRRDHLSCHNIDGSRRRPCDVGLISSPEPYAHFNPF